MQTFLVYFLSLASVVLLTYFAQRKDQKIYMICAALVLALVAGLRANTVGIDTLRYVELFDFIAEGKFGLAYGLETSFKYICAALLWIWNNDNFLFMIFALITNILIFLRLWDFKKQIFLPFSVIIYFGVFYFMTFNIMRQFVSVAIIFFATRYLVKKRYLIFLLFVTLAFLFHKSSLLAGLFIVFNILLEWEILVRNLKSIIEKVKNLTKKKKYLLIIFCAFASLAIILFGINILGKYIHYFQSIQFDFAVVLFCKAILFVFTAPLIDKKRGHYNPYYSISSYVGHPIKVFYAFGILLTAIGDMFPNMARIGLYFYLFETVYMGRLMKSRRIGMLMKSAVVALYIGIILLTILGNGQGQGNYLFYWQI